MSVYDRLPPSSIEAERAVLGSCLIDAEALADIAQLLVAEDFYDINHHEMFRVIFEMHSGRKPVDSLSVSEELRRRAAFDKLGGQSFIAALIDEVPTTANAAYHAGIVKEKSIQRKLIEAGNHIVRLGYSTEKETHEALDDAERVVFEVAQNRRSTSLLSIGEVLGKTVQRIELQYKSKGTEFTGFNSGFIDLDHVTGGFQKGSLNIIAARPSMGKTALALNIAQFGGMANAKDGERASVLIFSLEMSSEQLVQRMLSSEAQVNAHNMRTGMLSPRQLSDIGSAVERLRDLPLFIDDSSMLTTMEFRSRARRFKSRYENLGLVVVDYLQLMSHYTGRSDNKQQEVAEISRALKGVARELECPVVALSQLSRGVESRQDKKPMLSDLRDSGAIEQDADVVMMLYRKDYYDGVQDEENDSEASLNVAKNRNGPTREVKLNFRREFTRFFNSMG